MESSCDVDKMAVDITEGSKEKGNGDGPSRTDNNENSKCKKVEATKDESLCTLLMSTCNILCVIVPLYLTSNVSFCGAFISQTNLTGGLFHGLSNKARMASAACLCERTILSSWFASAFESSSRKAEIL